MCLLVTLLLSLVKLLGYIGWSWWFVLAPLWVPPVLFFLFCAGIVVGMVWLGLGMERKNRQGWR